MDHDINVDIISIGEALDEIDRKFTSINNTRVNWQQRCYDLVISIGKFHNGIITEEDLYAIAKEVSNG